jgi:hypothetical protein
MLLCDAGHADSGVVRGGAPGARLESAYVPRRRAALLHKAARMRRLGGTSNTTYQLRRAVYYMGRSTRIDDWSSSTPFPYEGSPIAAIQSSKKRNCCALQTWQMFASPNANSTNIHPF